MIRFSPDDLICKECSSNLKDKMEYTGSCLNCKFYFENWESVQKTYDNPITESLKSK